MDPTAYERGLRVTDEEMSSVDIVRDDFYGDWDYVIRPRPQLDLQS